MPHAERRSLGETEIMDHAASQTAAAGQEAVDTEPQCIDAPLSSSAAFLVLVINDGDQAMAAARSVVAGSDDLIKDVRIRANGGLFSCNVGISHRVWESLTGKPLPKELKPFQEIKGAKHTAVATAGDLLYHIRADSADLIVEFEKILLKAFGGSVTAVDDVVGFRYFDGRDLLEFVDGTANPDGLALQSATLVGAEDPAFAGGSYVVIQKYLHDLAAWEAEDIDTQEAVIGRTKFDNVEQPDATEGQKAHKTLCTIQDADGEHDILRDNMPFANPGRGEYGTYFIGYSGRLWVVEKMLERMFIGDPPPLHDRILDFSRAVAGVTFFAPARQFLSDLGQ
ncbi:MULTISPECIES: Dyp-type peroxidase [unclassified Streptomyces]|uniref:Dyp-type peroxidase n=1 Tax=unclassified Streptomyces TaxID=2593676 RepID=UPI0036EA4455